MVSAFCAIFLFAAFFCYDFSVMGCASVVLFIVEVHAVTMHDAYAGHVVLNQL